MRRPLAISQRAISIPHGNCETLWPVKPQASGQGADRSDCVAGPPRQAPNRCAVDAAEGCDRQSRRACQPRPADRTQGRRIWMTQRGEGGGEEGKRRTRPPRAQQVGKSMGGTGDETAATLNTGPSACAQVHPSAKRRRQPGITGYHKSQTSRAADFRQVVPKPCPARLAIVPQHDAGQPTRQARNGRARIRQPPRIGEEPERRKIRASAAPRVSPGEQTPIHRALSDGVLTGRRS